MVAPLVLSCLWPNPRLSSKRTTDHRVNPAKWMSNLHNLLQQHRLLILAIVTCASSVRATNSVTLAWDPNPEPDIAGYILYYGVASGIYTNSINVGHVTTNTISGLVEATTYFFVVTAYDTAGLESDPS